MDEVLRRYGRLDILIANAGINHRVALADWTPTDWDRLLAANLKACFFLAQHAAVAGWIFRCRRENRHGCIVRHMETNQLFDRFGWAAQPWPWRAALPRGYTSVCLSA